MSSRFLWIDLETTGLDPHAGSVLEVALVGVDDDDPAMPVLAQWSGVVTAGEAQWHQADDFVTNTHSVNGLWAECFERGLALGDVERIMLDFVRGDGSRGQPKNIVLAGGSVHFDLAWVRVHFPVFARCLSHRVFDVSTLKAAERTWGEEFGDIKAGEHRALTDVMASIDEARAIRARRWAR